MNTRAAILLSGLLLVLAARAGEPADFSVTKIADGVFAAVEIAGGKAGSNAGFIVGDKAVAVIDTFLDPAPAKNLLSAIRSVTSLPVRYVINTHYHLDHTGGNAVFADIGATIIGQRNVRAWTRTENLKFFGADPKPQDRARVAALVLPDLTFDDAIDIYLGTRQVNVRFMPGHTGGDAVVVVPDANVVFAGDLVWQGHLPNLIDASTPPWIKTLDRLSSEHPAAVFVPGHGDLTDAHGVQEFRDYLIALRTAVAKAQSKAKPGDDWKGDARSDLKSKYGTWGFFDHFILPNIEQTAAELAGQKTIPQPK